MKFLESLYIFGWLLWRDIRVLKQDILNNLLDVLIIPSTTIIISGYILPFLGVPASYGSFMVIGALIMACYTTTIFRGARKLAIDLQLDRSISYELTLPIPYWAVILKYGIGFAVMAMALNCLTIPVGKLLLWHKFNLQYFSFFKTLLSYFVINTFFGMFALWVVSWTQGMDGLSRFFLRYGGQIMFFSGMQFSWSILHKAVPMLANISLMNPFMYTFEALRAAVLGQHGYLNYWVSLAIIVTATAFFTYRAVIIFKNRLDCV